MRVLPLLCAALAAPATAQVVINEIQFSTPEDDAWIELHNRDANDFDLSNWSLFYASTTPGMPNNYWWAFPVGTTVPANGFLRVHWFEPYQAPTARDVWTGTSLFNFLFGYGGEALVANEGALGLLSSNLNLRMNDPSIYEDWVSWGSGGLLRENFAVQNGRWIANQAVSGTTPGISIALIDDGAPEPTPVESFFFDATPTRGLPNHEGADVSFEETPCSQSLSWETEIEIPVIPAAGASGFRIVVTGADAGNSEQAVALIFGARSASGLPLGPTCSLLVDPLVILVETPNGSDVEFPLTIPDGLGPGVGVAIQGALLNLAPGIGPIGPNGEHALTSRVILTFGI